MKNVVGGVKIGNLVTVLDVTPADVDQILDVQTDTVHFIQPHCVAQDQRQRFPAFPSLYGVGAVLQARCKTQVIGENAFPIQSRIFVFWCEKRHLSGHALFCYPSNGLTRHFTPEHRVDRVEEAGFAGSDKAHQQDPGLGNGPDAGPVLENVLHQLLPLPTGDVNRSEGDFRV